MSPQIIEMNKREVWIYQTGFQIGFLTSLIILSAISFGLSLLKLSYLK